LLLEECLSSSFSPLVLLVVVDMILRILFEVLPQEVEELARPIGSKPGSIKFTKCASQARSYVLTKKPLNRGVFRRS